MRKFIIGLMLLGSFSSFAAGYNCKVTEKFGDTIKGDVLHLVSPKVTNGYDSIIVGNHKAEAYYYQNRLYLAINNIKKNEQNSAAKFQLSTIDPFLTLGFINGYIEIDCQKN
jgi:hypothetical protein